MIYLDMAYDKLFFLIGLTFECSNKMAKNSGHSHLQDLDQKDSRLLKSPSKGWDISETGIIQTPKTILQDHEVSRLSITLNLK